MFDDDIFGLRKLGCEDLPMVLRWRNSDHVRKAMFNDHLISPSEHQAWFGKITANPHCSYLIFENNSSPVGMVYFTDVDFVLRRSHWGFYLGERNLPRGLGLVMGYKGIEYAFDVLDVTEIIGEVLDDNTASIKFHQSLGFSKRGELEYEKRRGLVFRLDVSHWLNERCSIATSIIEKLKRGGARGDRN